MQNARPRWAKANTHPAQVVLDAKQKQRTTSEKAADDEAKVAQENQEATNAMKKWQAAIAWVGALEDALQWEDKAYPSIVSKTQTQCDSDDNRILGEEDSQR